MLGKKHSPMDPVGPQGAAFFWRVPVGLLGWNVYDGLSKSLFPKSAK